MRIEQLHFALTDEAKDEYANDIENSVELKNTKQDSARIRLIGKISHT